MTCMLKKSLFLIIVLISFTSCGGSGSSSPVFETGPELSNALSAAQMACTGYKETPKADREFGQESALDVGACEISGESVDLTIWKDSGQKKNWEGLGKTMGCAFGKAFGITSFDYVDGGLWTISGTSETLAKEVANKMDAKAVHVDC
jgi:hypothetical protein